MEDVEMGNNSRCQEHLLHLFDITIEKEGLFICKMGQINFRLILLSNKVTDAIDGHFELHFLRVKKIKEIS